MNENQSLRKIVAPRAVEFLAIHIHQQVEQTPRPKVKKLSKSAGSMRYASIKLCQPALRPGGRLGLGVTEEIETALVETVLGCAQAWSCVLTCGLVSFEPPKDMSHLSFFADNDESGTGQRSAAVLGKRGQRAFLRRRWLETGTTNCGFGRRGYDDVEAYV